MKEAGLLSSHRSIEQQQHVCGGVYNESGKKGIQPKDRREYRYMTPRSRASSSPRWAHFQCFFLVVEVAVFLFWTWQKGIKWRNLICLLVNGQSKGMHWWKACRPLLQVRTQKSKTVRTQTWCSEQGTTRLIFIVSQLSAAVLYAQLYDTGFSVCFYEFLSDNGLGEPLV